VVAHHPGIISAYLSIGSTKRQTKVEKMRMNSIDRRDFLKRTAWIGLKGSMPPKYELALEEGNGETAKRLLALLALYGPFCCRPLILLMSDIFTVRSP